MMYQTLETRSSYVPLLKVDCNDISPNPYLQTIRFLKRYSEWIIAGIDRFDGESLTSDQLRANNQKTSEAGGATPCASSPCGENAVCWNSG